jgi:hypothetical protein
MIVPSIPIVGAGHRGTTTDDTTSPLPWLVIVAVVSAIAVSGALSLSSIFYMRDLAGYFWPHHFWLRRTVLGGSLPLWASEFGLGYATIADPNLQLLFPLTLPMRLLLPETLGFNVMVALPVPLAAIGAFLFLHRRFTAAAAALGALVIALSGPFMSSLTSPNLSTSIAIAPWALWALDRTVERPSVRRGAVLAVIIGLELLGGEPLTAVVVGALCLAYAVMRARGAGHRWRHTLGVALVVVVWQGIGALLAAVQYVPLLDAASRSPRVTGTIVDGWSVHPFALLEAVAPALFGGAADPVSQWSPWLFALNGGREPFLGSLYVGAGTIVLALLALLESERRRWVAFWTVVLVVALVMALGYFTPVYPWLRSTLPLFRSFRFPAKFAVIAVIPLGCLVAAGWDALRAEQDDGTRARRRAAVGAAVVIAVLGLLALSVAQVAPGATSAVVGRLAVRVGLHDEAASDYLARSTVPAVTQLVAIAAATALCVWLAGTRRRAAPAARALLFIAIVLNLFAANAALNPMMPASSIGHPAWLAVARAHPESRIYSPQPAILPKGDRELPATLAVAPDMPAPGVTALYQSTLGAFPIAPGLQSVLAPDLTKLRPVAYTTLLERFATSDRDARDRFLRRVGTRYFLAKDAPEGARRPVVALDGIVAMTLYEEPAPTARALVVPSARVVPSLGARIGALFREPYAIDKEVLLDRAPPAAAGAPGPSVPPGATIVEDRPTRVTLAAAVPEGGGYVVLLDSYDPNWVAEVDGQSAPLLEADGLFRAVRVAPGRHDVVFRYRSRPLLMGFAISLATALVLVVACALARPTPGVAR